MWARIAAVNGTAPRDPPSDRKDSVMADIDQCTGSPSCQAVTHNHNCLSQSVAPRAAKH